MPRLLLRDGDLFRHLASVVVTDDGSLNLSLVRRGVGTPGYQWTYGASGAGVLVEREAGMEKTKRISVHTSGRVNYHFGERSTRYIPGLLDLDEPEPIIVYSIPSVDLLDECGKPRKDDWIGDMSFERDVRISFQFLVLPAVSPHQVGEMGRLGVEGLYALAWTLVDSTRVMRTDLQGKYFATLYPIHGLPQQSVAEEVAYLRFRQAMYASHVREATKEDLEKNRISRDQIEALIEQGPGLYPPNGEGVWTVLARVPMFARPELTVEFEDDRYEARVVDYRAADTRLQTVRVRFKVFDKQAGHYEKGWVRIRSYALDARL